MKLLNCEVKIPDDIDALIEILDENSKKNSKEDDFVKTDKLTPTEKK